MAKPKPEKPQRRVTATMDADTVEQAERVLDVFGLKSATVITMLFSRIAATGSIDFPLALTDEEMKQVRQGQATNPREYL